MTETIAEYLARTQREQQNATVGAATVVIGATQEAPDEVAGALNLANEFGKLTGQPVPPTPMVKEYRNVFQQKVEEAKAKTILSGAPKLADWLRNPENAALAKDDLDNLSWWDRVGGNLAEVPKGIPGGAVSGVGTAMEGTGQLLTPVDPAVRKPLMDRIAGARSMTPEEVAALRQQIFQQGEINPQIAQSVLSDVLSGDMAPADAIDALEPVLTPALKAASEWLQKSGQATQEYGAGLVPAAPGFEDSLGRQVGSGIGSLLTILGVGWLTGGTGAAAFGGAMGAGEAVSRARQAGADEDTQTIAALYGILPGMTDAIPVERLLNNPVTKAGLAAFLRGVGIQALTEGGQEATQQIMQNWIAQTLYAPDQSLVDGAWDNALSGGIVGALAEAGKAAVSAMLPGRLHLKKQSAEKAPATQEKLATVSQQAQQSALRNRMPDRFRQFVEQAAEGTPVENIYVPAEQFREYFQSNGIDPFDMIDELDGVSRDDFTAALAGGGSLKIPTATYAAKIAGSDYEQFFTENSAFSPDDMTAREAAEFNEKADQILQEAYDFAEAARVEEEHLSAIETQIYDSMVARLRTAGRSTDVATAEAMLYPAFYRVMAKRSGMTTEEFLGKYPLPSVVGDLPQGMQFKNVDELNRTLAELRTRKNAKDSRQTLLEFIDAYGGINDRGGELRSRNAETIKRKGKKPLKLARSGFIDGMKDMLGSTGGKKHGIDDVAQAVFDAGFLQDSPVYWEYKAAMENGTEAPDLVPALWEAIDRELAGDPQYQADPKADAKAAREAELDQMEAYLNSLGVSLDDSDADIRGAVEGAKQYAQARDVTETPEFKAWFGDSKVVDEDGKPLVVYHGSGVSIDAFSFAFTGKGNDALGSGFYFTTERSEADSYSQGSVIGSERIGGSNQPTIHDVYLSIKNPIDAEGTGTVTAAQVRKMMKYAPNLDDGLSNWGDPSFEPRERLMRQAADAYAFDDENIVKGLFSLANDFFGNEPEGVEAFNRAVRDVLGYDGVASNVRDGVKHFVAFFPEQIKSVNNRGTFDANDPRILYQTAYHGTPHLFEKFSTDHIGTGEGAQAFGWGLYFAGKKEIAEHYRDMLSKDQLRVADGSTFDPQSLKHRNVKVWADKNRADVDATISQIEERIAADPNSPVIDMLREDLATMQDIKARGGLMENTGRLFEVDVPEDGELLNFDQRLSEQPERIQHVMRSLGIDDMIVLGSVAYADIAARMGRDVMTEGPDGWTVAGDASAKVARDPDPRAASLALAAAGIPGHRFLDGTSRSTGEGTYNYVIYDDSRVSVQSYEQQNRGSIQFPAAGVGNGETVINLFKSADLSTMLHESGHYFLTVMQDMARQGGPAAQEFSAVKSWWRENAKAVAKDAMRAMPDVTVTEADVLAALDSGVISDPMLAAAIDIGMQEQFARGFEQYLMEGKAPSVELRSVFEKFRAWLVSIYKRLAGLNVQISDDIRGVFDRMLASDEEIEKARDASGETGPIFATAEQMGVTQEEFDAYMKTRMEAEEAAKAKLLGEAMAPVKRAQEQWFKDEREKVRADVERNMNASPVYRAIEWMGNRRWLGSEKPEDMPDIRLSRDILVERYGEGVLKTLPRGKFTVYAVEGGVDPDDVAAWFGFESGDQMIRAMERAPKRAEAIEAETDKAMRDLHGDPLNDGSIEAAALAAVHNDKKGEWLEKELKAVIDVAGFGELITRKEARASAKRTLSRMQVRDAIAANRFLAAERKAADQAASLARQLGREGVWMQNARRRISVRTREAIRGDAAASAPAAQVERANASTANYNETVAKLIEAKRRQLINHALYMEARKVADEVEGAENLVARLQKAIGKVRSGKGGTLAGDYVEPIEAILDGYEFRNVSGRKIDRRSALLAYVEKMREAGRMNELAIPQAVLDDARKVNYKTLTVEHLRGVVDSLKNIEHMARLKGKLMINQKKREFEEVRDTVVSQIVNNVGSKPIEWSKGGASWLEQAGEWGGAYIASIRTATYVLRQIDGRADLGPAYEALKSDMDAAGYEERRMLKAAADDMDKIMSVYSAAEQRDMQVRRVRPELGGRSFSKWEMIAMALNMGNEGNLARLTNKNARMHLSNAEVEALKLMLDKRDAEFVQAVWDHINSFRPLIEARERRVRGVAPVWVEPAPVEIGGVKLRGGYYPIKYDGRFGGRRGSVEVGDDIIDSMMSGRYASASTKDGHLKARGEDVRQSLTLDIGVIAQHVNEVIHDLAYSEPLVNTWKILNDDQVSQAFREARMDEQHKMLKLWVQDVASGQVSSGATLEKTFRYLRSGFTYSKLAYNMKTVITQPLGLMQSASMVGSVNMLKQVLRFMSSPKAMHDEVVARSRMMWDRRELMNKEIADFVSKKNTTSARGGAVKEAFKTFADYGMAPMMATQFYLVDIPTWSAAYEKGLKTFDGDAEKAAHYADITVEAVQGSGRWSERSGIERGSLNDRGRQSPWVIMMTTLGSYFFTKMNIAIEKTQGVRAAPLSFESVLGYAVDMTLLFAGEAVVMALFGMAFGGGDDGEDDGTVAGQIAVDSFRTFLAGMPGVRDAVGLYDGFSGGSYAAIMSIPVMAAKQIEQGEVDAAAVKSVVNLVGMLARIPSSQINRSIVDPAMNEKGDLSPIEYLIGRQK